MRELLERAGRVALKRTAIKRKAFMRARRQPRTGNKFGVARPDLRTYRGQLYDSKLEMNYAARLDLQRSAIRPDQCVVDVRRQVSVPLEVNGRLICRYRLDFVVTYADGRVEWVELKGFETPEWKIKAELFRALFPERRYVVRKKA